MGLPLEQRDACRIVIGEIPHGNRGMNALGQIAGVLPGQGCPAVLRMPRHKQAVLLPVMDQVDAGDIGFRQNVQLPVPLHLLLQDARIAGMGGRGTHR